MNQDVPAPHLRRRCGNCHHSVRSETLDASMVACVVRLEYHCADHAPDCAHFHPAVKSCDEESGED